MDRIPGSKCSVMVSTVLSTISLLALIIWLPILHSSIQRQTADMIAQVDLCKMESRDIWKQVTLAPHPAVNIRMEHEGMEHVVPVLKDHLDHAEILERMDSLVVTASREIREEMDILGIIFPLLQLRRELVRSVRLDLLDHLECLGIREIVANLAIRANRAVTARTTVQAHPDPREYEAIRVRPVRRDREETGERSSMEPLQAQPARPEKWAPVARLEAVELMENPDWLEWEASEVLWETEEIREKPDWPDPKDRKAIRECPEVVDIVKVGVMEKPKDSAAAVPQPTPAPEKEAVTEPAAPSGNTEPKAGAANAGKQEYWWW
ncbi:unnamed protein product, partial [Mesorhabditis spiculigera]